MKRFWRRGDTLVEVTIALAILSLTLMGATRLAIRAFQQSTTARERTALSLTAQQQLEYLRNFRDTRSWAEFTQGSLSGTFKGVLSPHTASCNYGSGCFVMQKTADGYVPVDGSVSNATVPDSFLEITADGTDPDLIKFTVTWSFKDISGGPDNRNRVTTQLSRLTAAVPTPAPTPAPTPGPTPAPTPCANIADIAFVLDMSMSMTWRWYDNNSPVGAEPNRFNVMIPLLTGPGGLLTNAGIGPGQNQGSVIRFAGDGTTPAYNPVYYPPPELAQSLTFNVPSLVNKVDQQSDFTPEYATRYRAAMTRAKNELLSGGSARSGVKKVMVFISDGFPDDVDWYWFPALNETAVRAYVDSEIRDTDIIVHTIGIQPAVANNPVLQYMAAQSGGNYYPINTASGGSQAQFDAALDAVANLLDC